MRSLLFILFMLIVNVCNAQETFIKTFDRSNDRIALDQLLALPDGETALLTNDQCDFGINRCKKSLKVLVIDKSGFIKSFKSVYTDGSFNIEHIRGIITKDSSLLVVSKLYDTIQRKGYGILIIKFNKQGNVLWKQHLQSSLYDDLSPISVKENNNGELVLLYDVYNKNISIHGFQIVKLNKNGRLLENITIRVNAGYFYFSTCLLLTNNGDIVIGGATGGSEVDYGSVIRLNNKGKIIFSKLISSHIYTYYLSIHTLKLYEQNDQVFVIGGAYISGDSLFILPIKDNVSSSTAYINSNSFSNYRSYFKVHRNLLPFTYENINLFSEPFYFDKNLNLITVKNIYDYRNRDYRNVLIEKYDSLGRICPDYELPESPAKAKTKEFDLSDIKCTILKDSVFIKDDIPINDSTVIKTYTYCEGKASKKEQLKSDNQFKLSIFPNPVKTNCQLQFISQKQQQIIIDVINIDGQKTKSITANVSVGKNNINLNTASLPKGFYLLRINNNFSNQIRFLKE